MAIATVPRGNMADIVVRQIPVDAVEVGANVRIDPGELEGLAASIRELGILQPVKAVEHPGGKYRLVFGQRRLLAARLAGLETIPALVVQMSGIDMPGPNRAIEQLVENLDRRDLNPIEEAKALREVLDAEGAILTQHALAERLGRSDSWLANSLRLLGLDETVQEKVRAGEISASHGKAIASLPPKEQREISQRAVVSKLSAHDLEREIEWKRQSVATSEATRKRTEKWIPKVIAALDAAGTPKDAEVGIPGSYNIEAEPIRQAVTTAGWTNVTTKYRHVKPAEGKCDCTSVRVEIGRKVEILGACSDDRHVDRDRNVRHGIDRAAQEERARKLVAIGDAFAAGIAAAGLPKPWLRMLVLVARSGSFPYPRWEELDLDDAHLVAQLRELVADRPNRFDDATLEVVAAAFAAPAASRDDSQPAAAPAKPRKSRLQERQDRINAEATAAAGPVCSCGKPKVSVGVGRFVCTNPDHNPAHAVPA